MLVINIFGDISSGLSLSHSGQSGMFSATQLATVLQKYPDEKEVKINIHSDGGSVHEGLAIYDILRNSGKKIYTNIAGSCHSIATIILLAAPFENRSANQNARALIHQVRAVPDDAMTFEQLRDIADNAEFEQAQLLHIYAERTKLNLKDLETVMLAEKIHSANELLEMGFISKINSYNTNKKTNKMAKDDKKKPVTGIQALINKIGTAMKSKTVNYDFKDADGEVVFSTASESDELNVGDSVTLSDGETAGTFVLEDGREVTIEDNVITDIVMQGSPEEYQALLEEVEQLRAENEEFRGLLNEASEALTNLRDGKGSSYAVRNRMNAPKPKGKAGEVKTREELIAEAREKRDKFKNRKTAKTE